MIINYSTGAVGVSIEKRLEYLRELRPEVGALNMGSMNYAKYSKRRKQFVFHTVFENSFDTIMTFLNEMNELGIKPEHECFDSGHIANLDPLLDMGLLREPLQISCVMGVTGGIRPNARNLAHMSEQIPGGAQGPNEWGVIGISRDQWMLAAAALTLGGNVPRRPGGQLLPAERRHGALQRRPDREGAPDGRGRRARPATVAEARGDVRNREDAWPPKPAATRRRRCPERSKASGSSTSPGCCRAVCTLLLADLGADVLKVEDTAGGDYIRWMPPFYGGEASSARASRRPTSSALNRNKRSLRLNLKDERGREVLLRLVEDYDVLVESFRPGVMDRLGVGYDVLRERNPRLIYCPISGYGQDGPLTARSGHDTNYLALNGLLGLTGRRGGPPIQSAGQIADLGGGGLMAAVGILAALIERERSARGPDGGHLDDRRRAVLARDGRRAILRRAAGAAPRRARADRRHRVLRPVRDQGRRLGVARRARAEVLAELVRGSRAPGPRREAVRAPGLRGRHRDRGRVPQRTRDEWTAFAGEHDCCLEPILDLDEALDSELVRARDGRRARPAGQSGA